MRQTIHIAKDTHFILITRPNPFDISPSLSSWPRRDSAFWQGVRLQTGDLPYPRSPENCYILQLASNHPTKLALAKAICDETNQDGNVSFIFGRRLHSPDPGILLIGDPQTLTPLINTLQLPSPAVKHAVLWPAAHPARPELWAYLLHSPDRTDQKRIELFARQIPDIDDSLVEARRQITSERRGARAIYYMELV